MAATLPHLLKNDVRVLILFKHGPLELPRSLIAQILLPVPNVYAAPLIGPFRSVEFPI